MHRDLKVIKKLESRIGKKLEEWPLKGLRPVHEKTAAYIRAINGRVIGLHLQDYHFSDIAPLVRLTALTSLHIEGNQINDLAPLSSLTALTELYMSDNQINDLAPLSSLTALTRLDLNRNQINDLAPLSSLTALTKLSLDGNQINDLAPLSSLTKLHYLSARGNPLKLLALLPQQAQSMLYLDYDTESLAAEIPASIIAQGTAAICSYSMERASAPQRWVSKLVVLGCGGTGKTSLLRRLNGETFQLNEDTTHGIRLGQLALPHPQQQTTMTLFTWDFGGQDIYHATHQFFLTEGALVLVTWNARLGPEQSKVEYWLENIRSRAPQAPILLVATHVDQRPPDIAFQELKRRFPRLQGQVAFSSSKDIGLAKLKAAIAQHAARLPLMGERWPASWLHAADHLCALKSQSPYLFREKLHAQLFAAGLQQPHVHQTLARWLHQLGEILWFLDDPELRDLAMLDPQWVTQAISLVLESEEVTRCGGLLSRTHLRQLWHEIDPSIHDHLLTLMEKFDLSYKTEDSYDRSLVVERLPYEPPAYQERWESKADQMEISLSMHLKTSLPPGIPTWFIARMHRFSLKLHWRFGALFEDRESLGFIHANQERRTVTLTVRGPNPWPFFSRLRDTLDETLDRYPGLEIERLIPCCCHHGQDGVPACTYLFNLDRVEEADRKEIPALQCLNSYEMVPVGSLLYGLTTRSARQRAARATLHQNNPINVDHLIYGQDQMLQPLGQLFDKMDQRHEQRHLQLLANLDQAKAQQEAIVAMLQRQFLRQYRVEQSQLEHQAPSVFSLHPTDKDWLPEWFGGKQVCLQLYCQCPGNWHSTEPAGRYHFNLDPQWLVSIKPLLRETNRVLKCIMPLLAPAAGLAMAEAASISPDLKMMEGLAKSLETFDQIEVRGEKGEQYQLQQSEGAALRSLRQQLEKLDPNQSWGGLAPVYTPEGEILWLCDDHRQHYT